MARKTYTGARASVDLSGPMFTGDPSKRMGQNIRKMLEAVSQEGERTVRERSSGHRKTGAFSAGIVGRASSLRGKPWLLTAVVSQTHVYPWRVKRAGVRAQAEYRGGKLERKFHMFRTVSGQLRRARAVLAANLTEGLE